MHTVYHRLRSNVRINYKNSQCIINKRDIINQPGKNELSDCLKIQILIDQASDYFPQNMITLSLWTVWNSSQHSDNHLHVHLRRLPAPHVQPAGPARLAASLQKSKWVDSAVIPRQSRGTPVCSHFSLRRWKITKIVTQQPALWSIICYLTHKQGSEHVAQ